MTGSCPKGGSVLVGEMIPKTQGSKGCCLFCCMTYYMSLQQCLVLGRCILNKRLWNESTILLTRSLAVEVLIVWCKQLLYE